MAQLIAPTTHEAGKIVDSRGVSESLNNLDKESCFTFLEPGRYVTKVETAKEHSPASLTWAQSFSCL